MVRFAPSTALRSLRLLAGAPYGATHVIVDPTLWRILRPRSTTHD
jgi:hypothetical protein